MTVNISKPALNIRELLKKGHSKYSQVQFWFVGDASETDFQLEHGWKPLHVFDAGALQKEGSGDEYTVSYNGYRYSVIFSVAPSNLNDICIVGVR